MPKKRFNSREKIILVLAAFAAVFVLYCHFETYWIEVRKTSVFDPALPAEFSGKKILFISDIHCGDYFSPKRLGRVVDQVNSLKPDIIILGGDYVNTGGEFTPDCFRELARLDSPLGKFGILGNHDPEAGEKNVLQAMENSGIVSLINENRAVSIGTSSISIAGTDETWYGNPDGAKTMENTSSFTVYASHDPFYLEKYSSPKTKLMLSGHTHGGQITLFGIPFANIIHGQNYKYQKGIYFETGRTVIVTNGIGATVLPLRFFARPQIDLITLNN